jgi:hypothetical protein
MPILLRIVPWEDAHEQFVQETAKVVKLYNDIPQDMRTKRVLIPKLMGLEDSSRYWSADMVLDHMMIVSRGMSTIIHALDKEQKLMFEVKTADVKPRLTHDTQILPVFEEKAKECLSLLKSIQNKKSKTKHNHPWFGALDTQGWNILMAVHQKIHRRQMEKILKILQD